MKVYYLHPWLAMDCRWAFIVRVWRAGRYMVAAYMLSIEIFGSGRVKAMPRLGDTVSVEQQSARVFVNLERTVSSQRRLVRDDIVAWPDFERTNPDTALSCGGVCVIRACGTTWCEGSTGRDLGGCDRRRGPRRLLDLDVDACSHIGDGKALWNN